MSGMLIAEYLLSQKERLTGLIPENRLHWLTTIVSTNMADAVAKEYGLKLIEVLTGFKYIGEQIKFFEQTGIPMSICSASRRATAVLSEHMQGIRMPVVAVMCSV